MAVSAPIPPRPLRGRSSVPGLPNTRHRAPPATHRVRMFHQRIDRPLLIALMVLAVGGLALLFSASGGDWTLVAKQGLRLAIGLVLMIALALTPPRYFRLAAPVFYLIVLLLLVLVMFVGAAGQGAQRWLDLGPIRVQPAELMKIALPLALAWFCHEQGRSEERRVGTEGRGRWATS